MKRIHVASLVLCVGFLSGSAYGEDKPTRDNKAGVGVDKSKGSSEKGCNWGERASRDAINGHLKDDTLQLSLERVRQVQHALVSRGYTIEVIDGSVNSSTKAALSDFQEDFGLKSTGRIDFATLHALGFDVAVMIKGTVKGADLVRSEMARVRTDAPRTGAGSNAPRPGDGSTEGSTGRRLGDGSTEGSTARRTGDGSTRPDGSPANRPVEGSAGRPIDGVTTLPAGMPIDVNLIGSTESRALGYVVLGNKAIKSIQEILKDGKFYFADPGETVTEEFVNAVRAFQRSRGIAPKGFIDLPTLAAMTDADITVEPTNRMDPYRSLEHGAVKPDGVDGDRKGDDRPRSPSSTAQDRDEEIPRDR